VGQELSSRVQSVFVDRQGLAWAGMRSGLAVLHPSDGSVQTVDALNGDSVLTVFEDAEGNHWVGTAQVPERGERWRPGSDRGR
jgi:ligand-binding sensor domain-containing protein